MTSTGEDLQFTQIWAETFDKYQHDTKRDIKTDPVLARLRTMEDLLREIDKRQQGFEGFRRRHSKLWETLRAAMKPVELIGGMTQGALTLTPFSPASTVLGAVLFLVGVSLEPKYF